MSIRLLFPGLWVYNLAESFTDNVWRDKVANPELGGVVYCDLGYGGAEHSGIYVGDGKIVHLNGDGLIELVTPGQFRDRLGSFNSALSIYTCCNETIPVGSRTVASRAKHQIGKKRDYNLLLQNCHQFTAGCLTGDFSNRCTLFYLLKQKTKTELLANTWRVWDINVFE